jgi:hypothetical protein
MTKNEFLENYLNGTDEEARQFAEDLDAVIQTEIEEYEREQWKPYPENKPENYVMYWVRHFDGEEGVCLAYNWDLFVESRKVIAFRSLPKPYQP